MKLRLEKSFGSAWLTAKIILLIIVLRVLYSWSYLFTHSSFIFVFFFFLTLSLDEFMDAWVYVVLKSKIPNLASTIAILRGYSNPNLAFSEAGYYLSSVEFACRYLERINEQDYRDKSHLLTERLVVCEQARLGKMAQEETAVFEIVSQDKWLQGFEVFAVKEWHLDPTR